MIQKREEYTPKEIGYRDNYLTLLSKGVKQLKRLSDEERYGEFESSVEVLKNELLVMKKRMGKSVYSKITKALHIKKLELEVASLDTGYSLDSFTRKYEELFPSMG